MFKCSLRAAASSRSLTNIFCVQSKAPAFQNPNLKVQTFEISPPTVPTYQNLPISNQPTQSAQPIIYAAPSGLYGQPAPFVGTTTYSTQAAPAPGYPHYIAPPQLRQTYSPSLPIYQTAPPPQPQPTVTFAPVTYVLPPAPPPEEDRRVWESLPFVPTLGPGKSVSDFEADNRAFARDCSAAARRLPQGRTDLEAGLGRVFRGRNVFESPPESPGGLFRGLTIVDKPPGF